LPSSRQSAKEAHGPKVDTNWGVLIAYKLRCVLCYSFPPVCLARSLAYIVFATHIFTTAAATVFFVFMQLLMMPKHWLQPVCYCKEMVGCKEM